MKNKIVPVCIFLAFIVILLSIIIYYKKSTRNVIETLAENGKMINILIAGSNVYNHNKHSFHAVLSYNPEKNKIGITFIPPEFKVDLSGKGRKIKKINDVDINDFKSLSASLEHDLKLSIPFYVVLYSPDVERLIDMIEGLDLYVLEEINIHGIRFGLNYFDGDRINEYINSVEENSIFKKYDRIQNILLTLFYNKKKYEKYCNIEFISEILKTIRTNFLSQEMVSLGKLLYQKESDLSCTILPGFIDRDGFYVIDDITYKIYRNDFLKRLIVDSDTEQPVKVQILNGTDIAGLARKVRYKFVMQGFNVVEFGTASFQTFEKTVIINRRGEIGPVKRVSELIGVDNIHHIVDSGQLTNVLVILGNDLAKQ
ncbi:MAG: LytR C-terminal domain-containing protein [Spirochaetes bacterium]|nr:LytR C-terminal domain-containing protein [Spirochaetota bacterium]